MTPAEYRALIDGRDHLRRAVNALHIVEGLYVDCSSIERMDATSSALAQMVERAVITPNRGSVR